MYNTVTERITRRHSVVKLLHNTNLYYETQIDTRIEPAEISVAEQNRTEFYFTKTHITH